MMLYITKALGKQRESNLTIANSQCIFRDRTINDVDCRMILTLASIL